MHVVHILINYVQVKMCTSCTTVDPTTDTTVDDLG